MFIEYLSNDDRPYVYHRARLVSLYHGFIIVSRVRIR